MQRNILFVDTVCDSFHFFHENGWVLVRYENYSRRVSDRDDVRPV